MSMDWLDRRVKALESLPEDQRQREIERADRCPWCRVGLEHTEEEHDGKR